MASDEHSLFPNPSTFQLSHKPVHAVMECTSMDYRIHASTEQGTVPASVGLLDIDALTMDDLVPFG